MNKEKHMSTVEMDKLELEVKRHKDIALILAEKLNEKIDECEELKSRYESVNSQFRDELAEHKVLSKEVMRFEMALNRILDNCSDPKTMHNLRDLVTTVVMLGSEALHGDR